MILVAQEMNCTEYKYLSFSAFSLSFIIFISFGMANGADVVSAKLLLVLSWILVHSDVLNEFQKYENCFNIDAICTLLFAAKTLASHWFQNTSLMFVSSFSFLPFPLAL